MYILDVSLKSVLVIARWHSFVLRWDDTTKDKALRSVLFLGFFFPVFLLFPCFWGLLRYGGLRFCQEDRYRKRVLLSNHLQSFLVNFGPCWSD
jgi:hypothetical protein